MAGRNTASSFLLGPNGFFSGANLLLVSGSFFLTDELGTTPGDDDVTPKAFFFELHSLGWCCALYMLGGFSFGIRDFRF